MTPDASGQPSPPRDRRWFLRSAAVAAAGAGGALAGYGLAPGDPSVRPSALDVGFFTDMAFHHEQALAMCQRVLGRPTGDAVQASAAEILQNQSFERGLMVAWLQSWGASTEPPSQVMGWMGPPIAADRMPGLASDAEMRELSELQGPAKGRRFLELMRAHHVGGVDMADAAATSPTEPVARLATQMSKTQTYEIGVFDLLLSTTYADV